MGSRFVIVFVIVFALLVINGCYAQLTFTPNWGKRGGSNLNQLDFGNPSSVSSNTNGNSVLGNGDPTFRVSVKPPPNTAPNNCKPSIDSLMLIYHLIQTEADKLDDCMQK